MNNEKSWYPALYVIWKKQTSSKSGLSRHYRILTRRQLVYVVAGGKSQNVCIPYTDHQIIQKQKYDCIQVTIEYYTKNKAILDELMTHEQYNELQRKEQKTKALTEFFGGSE